MKPKQKQYDADSLDGSQQENGKLEESNGHHENGSGFDPVSEWGQPLGLPAPPPVSPTKSSRPATAPARGAASSRGAANSKRPGSSRSSPSAAKIPPLPPMTAFYMDLAYIPNHAESTYSDIEFFKRVRARYYVMSALSPNLKCLDLLLEAKATWEDKDLAVTVIPTYDNDFLRHWVGLNKDKLKDLHIDLTPAVSRCTIQLQDLETSLPAYRLEV